MPAIHQASTYVQTAPGRVPRGLRLLALGQPDAAALEESRSASWRAAWRRAFASGHGGRARADHRGLRGGATTWSSRTTSTAAPTGLVDKVLSRWGLGTRWSTSPTRRRSPRPCATDTKLIWVETPTNPTLKVVDMPRSWPPKRGAFVAVDNTFATPVYQRPLELGADAVVHSTTKYLGGHSDAVGGAVVVRDAERARARAVRAELDRRGARAAGLLPRAPRAAHAAPADGGAHRERARGVGVAGGRRGRHDVRWPGFSGMVCFRHPDATRIAAATRIFSLAESLGGVESLIEVPQAMTHQSVEGSAAAVPPDLVRLSCGVEAAEDLVDDLEQAIGGTTQVRAPRGRCGQWWESLRPNRRRIRILGGCAGSCRRPRRRSRLLAAGDLALGAAGRMRRAAGGRDRRASPVRGRRDRGRRRVSRRCPTTHAPVVAPVAGRPAPAGAVAPDPGLTSDDAEAHRAATKALPGATPPRRVQRRHQAIALCNGVALPPLDAPEAIKQMIQAGNGIARTPYIWGGGHGKWLDKGYDCSGSVSFVLAAAGLLNARSPPAR